MWLALIGAPTCKQMVLNDLLRRTNFKSIEVNFPRYDSIRPESAHLNLLDQHFRINLEAQNRMGSEDIITVGSFWTQQLVYAQSLRDTSMIEEFDLEYSKGLYERLATKLTPPSYFIYFRASHLTVRDRINLKTEEDQREDWVNAVIKHHEELVPRIRVPVVEVDASATYEKIWNDMEFEIDQMKTTRLSDATLWTRTMFRSGYT